MSSAEQCVGVATLFSKLENSLEASLKMCKAALMTSRSHCSGVTKSTGSSAYRLSLKELSPGIGERKPCSSIHLKKWLRKSIAMTNNMGDSGSPCLSLRAWHTLVPALPFNRILVLAVDRAVTT